MGVAASAVAAAAFAAEAQLLLLLPPQPHSTPAWTIRDVGRGAPRDGVQASVRMELAMSGIRIGG